MAATELEQFTYSQFAQAYGADTYAPAGVDLAEWRAECRDALAYRIGCYRDLPSAAQ